MTQRTALVLAGSTGIGAACARELARSGWRVGIVSRGSAALTELATAIGGQAFVGSITSDADLERVFTEAQNNLGPISALVNGSGHAVKKPLLEIADDEWREGLDLYLMSVIRTSRIVTPLFEAQGGGSIVNISTSSPFEPSARFPVSTTVRAALAAFTKIYSDEYGPSGIRMNNVLPGYTTEGWREVPPEWTSRIPLRRAAHPDEIAKMVRFLLSDEASYVTGQNIRVDGGVARSIGA